MEKAEKRLHWSQHDMRDTKSGGQTSSVTGIRNNKGGVQVSQDLNGESTEYKALPRQGAERILGAEASAAMPKAHGTHRDSEGRGRGHLPGRRRG